MGDISKPSMGLKPEDEEILINKVILFSNYNKTSFSFFIADYKFFG